MSTLVGLDDGEQGLLDLRDVHLEELVGGEGQFLALVDVLDELVGGEGDDLGHVEGEVSGLHLILDLEEVVLEDLLDLLDVVGDIAHVVDLLPLHLRHLRQARLDPALDGGNHGLDGATDQAG